MFMVIDCSTLAFALYLIVFHLRFPALLCERCVRGEDVKIIYRTEIVSQKQKLRADKQRRK